MTTSSDSAHSPTGGELPGPTSSHQSVEAGSESSSSTPWLWHGRIPSLDGLRAVSIIAVIIHHVAYWHPNLLPRPFFFVAVRGRIGVDVFFVISGFLITLLLLREQKHAGAISLRGFYLRRGFRIVPAYLAFCAGVFAIGHFRGLSPSARNWAEALTYTTDFDVPHNPWTLGHLWSLSIEEHFYLLWPVIMCYLPRRALMLALACIASAPLARLALTLHPVSGIDLRFFTLTRWDAIAMGCVLAFLMTRGMLDKARHAIEGKVLLLFVLVLGVLVTSLLAGSGASNRWCLWYSNTLRDSVTDASLTVILWLALEQHQGVMHRLLNAKAVVIVGWLSYSLYLWQQVFTDPTRDSWFVRFPVNMLCIVVLAICSYVLVERPFLSLRARIERRSLGEALAT